jgi:hypothetical protein
MSTLEDFRDHAHASPSGRWRRPDRGVELARAEVTQLRLVDGVEEHPARLRVLLGGDVSTFDAAAERMLGQQRRGWARASQITGRRVRLDELLQSRRDPLGAALVLDDLDVPQVVGAPAGGADRGARAVWGDVEREADGADRASTRSSVSASQLSGSMTWTPSAVGRGQSPTPRRSTANVRAAIERCSPLDVVGGDPDPEAGVGLRPRRRVAASPVTSSGVLARRSTTRSRRAWGRRRRRPRSRTRANTTPCSWISWSTAEPVYQTCGFGRGERREQRADRASGRIIASSRTRQSPEKPRPPPFVRVGSGCAGRP